jgi:hypothetical protein
VPRSRLYFAGKVARSSIALPYYYLLFCCPAPPPKGFWLSGEVYPAGRKQAYVYFAFPSVFCPVAVLYYDGLYARGDIQRYKQEVAPFLVLGLIVPL